MPANSSMGSGEKCKHDRLLWGSLWEKSLGGSPLSRLPPPPTLAVQVEVHHAVLDFHVPTEVPLQVELAGAVRALEGLAAGVQVHVAQEVVHAVEGLPTHL